MLYKLLLLLLFGVIAIVSIRQFTRRLLDFPEAFMSHIKWTIYHKWQGRYYAFDDKQVRIRVIGTDVWLAESDILGLLDPEVSDMELRAIDASRGLIPGSDIKGIRVEGVRRLLRNRLDRRSPSRDMVRLNWWLNNEAIPNVTRYPDSSM